VIPDRDCVPGLDRPVTVREYADLEGLSETLVLTLIRELKIRKAAYFRGQWFIEAPRNCEARLARLRGEQPKSRKAEVNVPRNDKGNIPALEDKEFWGPIEREASSYDDAEQNVRTEHQHAPKPAPAAAPGRAESEVAARLRTRVKTEMPSYGSLMDSEKKALLTMKEYSEPPQPVDYGLTYHDLHLQVLGPMGGDLEKPRDGLTYKPQGKWLNFLGGWKFLLIVWFLLYVSGFAIFVAQYPNLPGGGWTLDNPRAFAVFFLGMAVPGFMPGFGAAIPIFLAVSAIAKAITNAYKRSHPSLRLEEYRRALRCHELYAAAKGEAAAAARKAAHDAEMRKRSYWTSLDGYGFEYATAEVLNKHQFNAVVTPGSGDGGIDIEVARNGLKGVVQCKAHTACCGPAVVRDLYGVIHHTRASFGIIVSLGGFTRGAEEFARDKPIHLLDVSDLIAMQEGKDVLAEAFAGSSSSQVQ
jgi:hypothetical protein